VGRGGGGRGPCGRRTDGGGGPHLVVQCVEKGGPDRIGEPRAADRGTTVGEGPSLGPRAEGGNGAARALGGGAGRLRCAAIERERGKERGPSAYHCPTAEPPPPPEP